MSQLFIVKDAGGSCTGCLDQIQDCFAKIWLLIYNKIDKFQTTKNKLQIKSKSQYPIIQTSCLEFEYWNLFGIWEL